ncbi:hypothetical protein [Pseudomonas phage D6]|nr:hypothetical protein [Pseudomonas phage D6]
MSIYSEPVNTPEILYLNHYGSSFTFGELADSIVAHFGEDISFEQLSMEVERTKVRGCSCHYDNEDYETYLVITKRDKPQAYTSTALVSTLSTD